MVIKLKNEEFKLVKTATDILDVIDKNFTSAQKLKIPYQDIYLLFKDLNMLFIRYSSLNQKSASKLCISRYIPLLNLIVKVDINTLRMNEYERFLKAAYLIAARWSFEHFVIYYEWEIPFKDKFFLPRYEILGGYAYYLNRMTFDDDFEMIVANLPSGAGKTYLEKLSEAFDLGIHSDGSILSLCSNDNVVKGGSRTVMDIIKSPEFGEVFPKMKYVKEDKTFFLKETEGEWKLNTCQLVASYYATTTNSNVVGIRANRRIHIDDLYADYKEALDENLNKYYENKYLTVWRKRYVQNRTPKISITGTMWSPTDFMVKMIELLERDNKFTPCKNFKYVRISEDGKKVIIQVPAMDYDTGESTCKALWSTAQLEIEKLSMPEYLWQCNFQQISCSPEGLEFSYPNLKTYNVKPVNEAGYCKACIDGTRKSGSDYFAMGIVHPYFDDWAFVDCIFTKTATTELYDDIVEKIVKNRITYLLIESNVDNGLKKLLNAKLRNMNIDYCVIEEKYNTVPKSERIQAQKGLALRKIVYPSKEMYAMNTQMGQFMNSFTSYNSDGRNKHDDANDNISQICESIIDNSKIFNKVSVIKRPF